MTGAIMPDREPSRQAEPEQPDGPAPPIESTAGPYLVTAALALAVLLVLAAYLWLHRAEIVAILTQSPT